MWSARRGIPWIRAISVLCAAMLWSAQPSRSCNAAGADFGGANLLSDTLWPLVETYTGDSEAMSCSSVAQKVSQHTNAIVFISLSMPRQSLENLFAWAADQNPLAVQFVLRGWDDLVGMGTQLQQIIGKRHANVIVHPELYRGYQITSVPVFLIRKNNWWYRVTGDVEAEKAVSAAATLRDGKEPIGQVYPIKEPDILNTLEQKINDFHWETAVAEAKRRFEQQRISYVHLPPAKEPDSRHVDPSIVASQNIVLPNGQVAVHAGDRVNPLKYVGLDDKAIVVFNPQRSCEVAYAARFDNAYYLATELDMVFLRRFPKRDVFILTPEAVDRFGLHTTPSVVTQDGLQFKVTTTPCTDESSQ